MAAIVPLGCLPPTDVALQCVVSLISQPTPHRSPRAAPAVLCLLAERLANLTDYLINLYRQRCVVIGPFKP